MRPIFPFCLPVISVPTREVHRANPFIVHPTYSTGGIAERTLIGTEEDFPFHSSQIRMYFIDL
eukprot:scaffold4070_cov104-Cylindrotheca_fusiformis.AAC.4